VRKSDPDQQMQLSELHGHDKRKQNAERERKMNTDFIPKVSQSTSKKLLMKVTAFSFYETFIITVHQ
jgi:hypothetical protein